MATHKLSAPDKARTHISLKPPMVWNHRDVHPTFGGAVAGDVVFPGVGEPKSGRRHFAALFPTDDDAIQVIANELKDGGGIREPVVVVSVGKTGRYEIIDGLHRCRAADYFVAEYATSAGQPSVPAVVYKNRDEAVMHAVSSNMSRRHMSASQRCMLVSNMHVKLRDKSAAKLAGVSLRSWAYWKNRAGLVDVNRSEKARAAAYHSRNSGTGSAPVAKPEAAKKIPFDARAWIPAPSDGSDKPHPANYMSAAVAVMHALDWLTELVQRDEFTSYNGAEVDAYAWEHFIGAADGDTYPKHFKSKFADGFDRALNHRLSQFKLAIKDLSAEAAKKRKKPAAKPATKPAAVKRGAQ